MGCAHVASAIHDVFSTIRSLPMVLVRRGRASPSRPGIFLPSGGSAMPGNDDQARGYIVGCVGVILTIAGATIGAIVAGTGGAFVGGLIALVATIAAGVWWSSRS